MQEWRLRGGVGAFSTFAWKLIELAISVLQSGFGQEDQSIISQ